MGRVRGKDWMQEHVSDAYVKRARAEGMRSRAAYKLEEIARRDRLLAPGMLVVDLGAAPGGWSQVAAKRVVPGGRVIALDLLEMPALPGVTFIRGDFRDPSVVAELERALGGRKADLVLSDMAPNLSGIGATDQARVLELAGLALEFAMNHLKPRGKFLVKLFQGEGFEEYLRRLRGRFRSVAVRKPRASRERSSEVYLLAGGPRRAVCGEVAASGCAAGENSLE
ncbi:MAG TPA: RlmE family RNA methyltransferase [Burkholderiales bacterium]|nr:RlmE family RNA methyltransferase [Burkholderiales bacterium]